MSARLEYTSEHHQFRELVHDFVVVDLGLDVGPLSVLLADLRGILVGVVLRVRLARLADEPFDHLGLGEDAPARRDQGRAIQQLTETVDWL